MPENNYYIDPEASRRFPHVVFAISITIGILLLTSISEALITLSLPAETRDQLMPYIIGGGQLCFMLIPTYLAAKSSILPVSVIFRLEKNNSSKMILLSLIGFISIQFFVAGYSGLQEMFIPAGLMEDYLKMKEGIAKIYEELLFAKSGFGLLMAFVLGAILPAFVEELLFRGFLQRSLEEKMKYIHAIIISSVIFGIMHFNPIDLVPLIFMGFFLGTVAYATKSIFIPMMIHFLNNALAIMTLNMQEIREMDQQLTSMPDYFYILLTITGLLITGFTIHVILKESREPELDIDTV